MREPFWGPNAWFVGLQLAAGFALYGLLHFSGFEDWVYEVSGYLIDPLIAALGL